MHTPVLAHGCVREIQQLSPLLGPIDVALWTTVSADMPEGLLEQPLVFGVMRCCAASRRTTRSRSSRSGSQSAWGRWKPCLRTPWRRFLLARRIVTAWRQVLPGDRVGAICSPSMAHEHGVHQPVLPLCGVAIVGARVNCVVHGGQRQSVSGGGAKWS